MYVSNTNKITRHHEQGGRDLIGGVYSYSQQADARHIVKETLYEYEYEYLGTCTSTVLERIYSVQYAVRARDHAGIIAAFSSIASHLEGMGLKAGLGMDNSLTEVAFIRLLAYL